MASHRPFSSSNAPRFLGTASVDRRLDVRGIEDNFEAGLTSSETLMFVVCEQEASALGWR
jgi:hypothetical protein